MREVRKRWRCGDYVRLVLLLAPLCHLSLLQCSLSQPLPPPMPRSLARSLPTLFLPPSRSLPLSHPPALGPLLCERARRGDTLSRAATSTRLLTFFVGLQNSPRRCGAWCSIASLFPFRQRRRLHPPHLNLEIRRELLLLLLPEMRRREV